MSTESQVTFYQSSLVNIRSVITGDDDDNLIIVPITIPEGDDWKNLRAEDFRIDGVTFNVQPYYNNASMINKSVGDGVVTGDFPIYMQFFAGNTFDETSATNMNELLYTGVYVKGTSTTGATASLNGTVFKTILADGDKQKANGFIDASLLSNPNVNLQLGHVALSIRKSDFKIAYKSNSDETPVEAMRKRLAAKGKSAEVKDIKETKETKEVKEERKQGNTRRSNNRSCPKPEPEPEPEPEDDKAVIPSASSIYPEITAADGSLTVYYNAWIITQVDLTYHRKPY